MGFRNPITTATALDSADQFPIRMYKTGSLYPPAQTAVLELAGLGTVKGLPTAHGQEVAVAVDDYVSPGYPDIPGSSLHLRTDPSLDGAGAELRSTGDVVLTPFAGDAFRAAGTARAPSLAVAGTATAGTLTALSALPNFVIASPVVLTNASGQCTWTFPTPFPTKLIGALLGTAGTFGSTYQAAFISGDRFGVTMQIGREGGVLASTSLVVSVLAIGA